MARKSVCKVRKGDSLSSAGCRHVPTTTGRHSLFFMGPVYRVNSNETDIMYEIFTNGPVQGENWRFFLILTEILTFEIVFSYNENLPGFLQLQMWRL